MLPATSSPGMSGAPGGGGYFPCRCMMSGRLTPAAATLIRTSRAPMAGRGRSTGVSTWGPPGSRIAIAIMLSTLAFPLRGRELHEHIGDVLAFGHQKTVWNPGRNVNHVSSAERVKFSALDAGAQVL